MIAVGRRLARSQAMLVCLRANLLGLISCCVGAAAGAAAPPEAAALVCACVLPRAASAMHRASSATGAVRRGAMATRIQRAQLRRVRQRDPCLQRTNKLSSWLRGQVPFEERALYP